MIESRNGLWRRLVAEGRWEEACKFRDQKIRELREAGKTRRDANELAWEAMEKEFPPLEGTDGANGDMKPNEPSDVPAPFVGPENPSPPDLSRDTIWAYENLGSQDVKSTDAPTRGAWSLLSYARNNRIKFFEQLLPKAMAQLQRGATDNDDPGPGRGTNLYRDPEYMQRLDGMLADLKKQVERNSEREALQYDRVATCPQCQCRLVMPKGQQQSGTKQVHFPPAIACPADHPHYENSGFCFSDGRDSANE